MSSHMTRSKKSVCVCVCACESLSEKVREQLEGQHQSSSLLFSLGSQLSCPLFKRCISRDLLCVGTHNRPLRAFAFFASHLTLLGSLDCRHFTC